MEVGDRGCLMTMIDASGWMFLLVMAHLHCPDKIQQAVKRLCVCVCVWCGVLLGSWCISAGFVQSAAASARGWHDTAKRWTQETSKVAASTRRRLVHGNLSNYSLWALMFEFLFIIHANSSQAVARVISCICEHVSVCVCPYCKRKTAWALSTKVGTVHDIC